MVGGQVNPTKSTIVDNNNNDNNNNNDDKTIIPGFLKTGLAKISSHSTTWQFKTTKLIQRPIKSLSMTPGIPTSPN